MDGEKIIVEKGDLTEIKNDAGIGASEGDETKEKKIRLQVERIFQRNGRVNFDLLRMFDRLKGKKRFYHKFFLAAFIIGIFVGVIVLVLRHYSGHASYARALVSFQYEGIESGLDPNGAAFDVSKIKSPSVVGEALAEVGMPVEILEDVRSNISIEGVIPEDAVERITVIERMGQTLPASYEKLLDVTYFPSQYVIYLYDNGSFSSSELRELLDAILESYRKYFFDTYANTQALSVTTNLLDGNDYDYTESLDLIRTQINIMSSYARARNEEAPDFRATSTGLSFGDIITSLQFVLDADVSRISSFIETNSISKDVKRQMEYYNYQIKEYSNRLSENQAKLANITETIANYEKDPMIVVSNQDTTAEYKTKNEYYDQLIANRISLNGQIAEILTRIKKYQQMISDMQVSTADPRQEDFVYADNYLERLSNTVDKWTGLVEETTEEYYSTEKFSNAYQVAVPAQYFVDGGLMGIIKTLMMAVCCCLGLAFLVWSIDGMIGEVRESENKNEYD